MAALSMTVQGRSGDKPAEIEIDSLVIAGWAGRNREAMEHHVAELEALGIARPRSMPTFYRVSPARLTTDATVHATGGSSSGEAEIVVFSSGGEHFVGLGSDHTDRKVEAYGVTVSKQMCDKPVARTVWPLDEVLPHWDRLILRSHIVENGGRVLYQQGTVAELLSPLDLIERFTGGRTLPSGTAMFCGTLPAIGGVRPSGTFEGEVEDPVLGRAIRFRYDVAGLEDAG